MKLPKSELSVVEIEKLTGYCLNLSHPRGRHKARVFASVLSMTERHAEELRGLLLQAAKDENASIGTSDQYGVRYIIDFEIKRESKRATIRSIWIVMASESFPRFVTCYVQLS